MKKKNLDDFLKILIKLHQANIDFSNGQVEFVDLGAYEEEIFSIQKLINSFDFVKNYDN
jgi:hypothetical protein